MLNYWSKTHTGSWWPLAEWCFPSQPGCEGHREQTRSAVIGFPWSLSYHRWVWACGPLTRLWSLSDNTRLEQQQRLPHRSKRKCKAGYHPRTGGLSGHGYRRCCQFGQDTKWKSLVQGLILAELLDSEATGLMAYSECPPSGTCLKDMI